MDDVRAISNLHLKLLDKNESGICFFDFAHLCTLPGLPKAVECIQPTVKLLLSDRLSFTVKARNSGNILKKLLAKRDHFVTQEHYVWLIRTTIGLTLIKIGSRRIIRLLRRLFYVIECKTHHYADYSPSFIEKLAIRLKNDIPLPASSLVAVPYRLMMANCELLYHTAVALIFGRFDEIMGNTVAYRVRGCEDVLQYLQAYDRKYHEQQGLAAGNWLKVLDDLLMVLYVYHLMVIYKHIFKTKEQLEDEHGRSADHYLIEPGQLERIWTWLHSVLPTIPDHSKMKKNVTSYFIPMLRDIRALL